MNRDDAYKLLTQHIKEPPNLNHSREAEVIMRALARKLGEDEDYCKKCREILAQAGFDNEFIETIISHGYGFEACGPELAAKKRTTKLQHLLAAAETITGLIYASALVRPDKKLESVEVKSIKKKIKDKSFAAKVDRNVIRECEEADVILDEFIQISLDAMKEIAGEIGV